MDQINLRVNGQKNEITSPVDLAYPQLELRESISITPGLRAVSNTQSLTVKQADLIELVFADETRWLGPPDCLEEIYPGSMIQPRKGETVFELPAELDHPGISRGVFGNVLLSALNLFTRKKVEGIAEKAIETLARDLEEKQLGKFKGLVRINSDFEFEKPEGLNSTNPFLLFLHGTNSSTTGSFAELKGTPLWDHITKVYGSNILGFQHETLTKSPLQNAVDLIKQLPPNATLHLISHSRGGLIGEVLCRFSGGTGAELGFSKKEMTVLKDRAADIKAISDLQQLYPASNFRVAKFIRVASPSAGTTILSKRLDHFFNISLNLLGLVPGFAGSPVYLAMKNLLIALVDQKNDIGVLPGLEAMKPESEFITVLNNLSNTISIGEPVIAISGNCKMKVNLKALVIIASKLFFLENNDLVVNTNSMYNGSSRTKKLQFFFDEGTDVDHFHYFKNPKTNEAILLALKASTSTVIDGFTEFSRGSLAEMQRNAILGLDGGQFSTQEPSGRRPILVLLPGIMGSSLTLNNDLVWISYPRFFTGQLTNIAIDAKVIDAPSVIETSYKALAQALQQDYDVVVFPFDWRISLETAAGLFNEKITGYLEFNQPIKIVGHSMGGVLVRDFMVFHPDTWETLKKSTDFRLLFLGSPLRGSFRINNVLFGDDSLIDKLSKIDIVHSKKRLLEMFNKFPGLLCLLPFNTDPENDFAEPAVWKNMLDAFGNPHWPLPADGDLSNFGEYRTKILAATVDYSRAVYIAGQDRQTPCGYRIDNTIRGKELVFLSTAEGDQSVTWEMGIPKEMISAGTVYYANYSHGALSNTPALFNAMREILSKGQTSLLTKNRPSVRGDQRIFRKPVMLDTDLSQEGLENTILGISKKEEITANELPLKVKVSHGDLKGACYPLLAGHFRNDSILYAERRIDNLVANHFSEQHKLDIYPGDIGTYEIFLTHAEGFPGAIIVGLGDPDKLTSFELTRTIEQAVAKYLLNVNGSEKIDNSIHFKQPLGISSLLIGSGYGGLSVENGVSSILQGVVNANRKIRQLYELKKQAPLLIELVEFVELYENMVLECIYSVIKISKEAGGTLNITPLSNRPFTLNGARTQMVIGQTNEWWTRITVLSHYDAKGTVKGMRFSISTGAAREELRTIFTATGIVDQLIEGISTDNRWSEEKSQGHI